MDLRSVETALPAGAMRDIVNFDIAAEGQAKTRSGTKRLNTIFGAHGIWTPSARNFGLYVHGDALKRLTTAGTELISTTLLTGLRSSFRIRYFELDGEVFFTNGYDIGLVTSAGARLLGLPVPMEPTVVEMPGGMTVGRYGVALSYVSATGEESGLSPVVFQQCDAGGIDVALPTTVPAGIASIRVYATMANGEMPYMAAEMPVGFASANLQTDERSKLQATQFLARMPGGDDICVHGGRVYVSKGKVLRYSEPLNYGLTDPRFHFITFQSDILFHDPVVDGMYVGTKGGTYFLPGMRPSEQSMRLVGPAPVVDDSIRVRSSKAGGESESLVVVWVGRNGFTLGSASGAVSAVQSKRITLADHGAGFLADLSADGADRFLALVETTMPGADAASNSPI